MSEYLVERMLRAGATRLCFVIAPGKSDILEYYGGRIGAAEICYVVQPQPSGLCDAVLRVLPFIRDDDWVLVGLPDTIWFPEDALCSLDDADALSFLLFPVSRPELFDAVLCDGDGRVTSIRVKQPQPGSEWIWGAIKARGGVLRALGALWRTPARRDDYIGTLVNAYLAEGGTARGVRAGRAYVDVGTLNGYREAVRLLEAVKPLEDVRLISSPWPSQEQEQGTAAPRPCAER